MKQVVIMRGLPGSGKSTIAETLAKSTEFSYVCSADKFFIDHDGKYIFDRSQIGQAHKYCRTWFDAFIKSGTDLIIVDNTNVKRKDFAYYIDQAQKYKYAVTEVLVGGWSDNDITTYHRRCTHGVPLETIQRMALSLRESILFGS